VARLYANENFPFLVVEKLRQLGHDVVTIQETGKAEQRTPDEDVLQLAIADERAVLTLNRKHFIRLHQEQPSHAGIIVCTVDPDFARQAARIHAAIEAPLPYMANSFASTAPRANSATTPTRGREQYSEPTRHTTFLQAKTAEGRGTIGRP